MPTPKRTDESVKRIADAYRDHDFNTYATARTLGMPRATVQGYIRDAIARGYLSEEVQQPPSDRRMDYMDARARMVAAFQAKQRKGNWRKPVLVKLPEGPFRLKVFGDPHLDSSGCNFELFERHWRSLDPSTGTYGVCVGDWFNNWRQSLAHLWKGEGDPSDAWTVFEALMDEHGAGLVAACSGNHDDWSHAPVDPIDLKMKQLGTYYRKGAIRVAIQCGGADPVMVALRHKWQGKSMYSPAHWGVRAARAGWLDEIMIGGHIHQDEPRLIAHEDGTFSHVCQVSTFKEYDDYVDVHGFQGPKISPVWDLVIDPRAPRTSPDRVKVFWDSDVAARYLEAIR